MNFGFSRPTIANSTINSTKISAPAITASSSQLTNDAFSTQSAMGVAINNTRASSTRSAITTAEASPIGMFPLRFSRCIRTGSPPAIEGVMEAANRLDTTASVESFKLM